MLMKRHLITALLSTSLLTAHGYAGQTDQMAPGFSLTDLGGTTLTSEQFRGKVLLLVFWAPWCIPCRDELPEHDRLHKKYKDKGFEVIGISEDAAGPAVAAFLRKVPVSFPMAIDLHGSVAEAYRLSNLPSGYLIDRDGVIRHRYRGFDRNFVKTYEKDIFELLEQHKP